MLTTSSRNCKPSVSVSTKDICVCNTNYLCQLLKLIDMVGNCGDTRDDTKLLESRASATEGTSEFVTAVENIEPSTLNLAPASSMFISTRIQQIMQARSKFATEVESEIEASKDHWSQLETTDATEEVTETNLEVFKSLQKEWGGFFYDYGDRLKVGRQIAEGGQAEIFEAHIEYLDGNKVEYALKVFKAGYSLRALQKQWPQGIFQRKGYMLYDGTLLQDGRFAFRMQKCWGDLRKLIDMKMQHNHNQCMPFTDEEADGVMYDIAKAMRDLHDANIIHRDLKASNVLIHPYWESEELPAFDPILHKFLCGISDYESSLGVSGTGFWRAPEILLAQQNHDIKPHIFTEKSDVYSFGMTCYEVLTGCVPFEDIGRSDYDHVLCGGRPKLPDAIKPSHKALLSRCWHPDAAERPSFQKILYCLKPPNTVGSPDRARQVPQF